MHKRTIIPILAIATLAAATASAGAATVARPASLGGLRDLGHLAGTTRVPLAIGLKLRNENELDALLTAQQTKGSPVYHHFLTRTQVRDEFGVSAADYARLSTSLARAGFTVKADPLRASITVHGTAKAVESYFSTRLEAVGSGRSVGFANMTAAKAPAETADMIEEVSGMQKGGNTPRWATEASYNASLKGTQAVKNPALKSMALPGTTGPDGGYGPQSIADIYDAPMVHGFFGNGATIADIVDGPSVESDVNKYLNYFNLTRSGGSTVIENVDGGGGGDTFQADIDEEGALGVAPGAGYIVYSIPELADVDIVDGFEAVASDDYADVVNFSVEGPESLLGETCLTINKYIKLGTAEGQSFENIAFYDGFNQTSPSDSPSGVTVGGADAYLGTGTKAPPIVETSTGGGTSSLFAEPPYQAGLKGASKAGRNFPDMAGPATINNVGPSIYVNADGGWVGGFDFVDNAPIAGMLAGVDQLYKQRYGNVAPGLTNAFKEVGDGRYFTDVAYGTNEGGLSAAPGYDIVSGTGVPLFYELLAP